MCCGRKRRLDECISININININIRKKLEADFGRDLLHSLLFQVAYKAMAEVWVDHVGLVRAVSQTSAIGLEEG